MVSEKVPMSANFLRNTSTTNLKKMYEKAKKKTEGLRILACIKRKKGKEMKDIAAELEVPYPTIHRWLATIAREGISAISNKPKPGRPRRLTDKQCTKVYKIVSEGPEEHGYPGGAWTAKRLISVVEKEFGVTYGERGMQVLLHRIGLTSRMPRPRHPKAATPDEIATFKRRVAAIRGHMGEGTSVCMIDSASLIAGWNVQRGWYPVGESPFAPVTLSSTRAHMVGALYDGELDISFSDKVNKHTIVELLRRQMARHKKVLCILDNASSHHAKIVRALEAEFEGRLRLVYLPPYTPELNSIELVWRMIRKAIANVTYDTVEKMEDAVSDVLLSRDVLLTSIAPYARDKRASPPRWCIVRVGDKIVRDRYYL